MGGAPGLCLVATAEASARSKHQRVQACRHIRHCLTPERSPTSLMAKQPEKHSLSRSKLAVRGVFWAGVTILAPVIISSLVFVLTSRLLTPRDFGVVALASVIAAAGAALTPGGFGDALVQAEAIDELSLDSVFWLCAASGSVLYLAFICAAQPAAEFFHAPMIASVLPIVSLRVLLDTLGIVPTALVTRSMSFHLTAFRSLLASLLAAGLSVGLVLSGYGLWALVASGLASSAVGSAAMFWSAGWLPRPRFDPGTIRRLSGYGTYATGTRVLGFLGGQADQAVVGYVLGTTELGLYNFARRVFSIASDVTTGALTTVAHPLFSGIQNDLDRVRRGFIAATFLSSVVAFPCFLGLACVADHVVPIFFGVKWLGALWPIRILCITGVISCIGVLQAGLINSLGKPKWWFVYQLITNALNVPIIFGLSPHGVTIMLSVITAKAYILWFFPVRMTLRLLRMRVSEYLKQFIPPLLAAIAMTLAIFGSRVVLPQMYPLLTLAVELVVGFASYCSLLMLTARPRMMGVLALLSGGTQGRRVQR